MNSQTYIMCFLAGLLGILFHIFAVKLPSVKQNAQVANVQFNIAAFLKDESIAIGASLIMIIILLVVLDELVAFKPAVIPWLKAAFVFVGYTGSSLLVAALGQAQSKINQAVDLKTDIADGKQPGSPPTPPVV